MKSAHESLEEVSARQKEMEDHALALGGQRFRRKLENAIASGSEAQVGAARKLLTEGLCKVEAAMEELLVRRKSRPHTAARWVRQLGAPAAAYLALKVVLDNIHGRVSVRRAALDVTELVVDELRFRRFKEKEPQLFEYLMTAFTTSNYAHRARSLDARIHRAEVDISDLQMNTRDRFLVGVKLIDIVMAVTGLVRVESKKTKEGGKFVELVELVATPETIEWLREHNGALEFLWPVNLPMVMPPLPWAPGRKGGYRYGLRGKHRMVRGDVSKEHRQTLDTLAIPSVYSALNRIQETPWAINTRVLEVVQSILERGGGYAGIPVSSDQELPPQPEDMATNEVARKSWRRAASAVHESNHDARIKRADLFRLLSIADKVKEESAIWFPHNLDFRGRVYPVTNYLHPQGDDLCKGILTFAEGKPLGRDGVAYLALHGASSLGKTLQGQKLSHMTLSERVEYVQSISEQVCAVAADPLSNSWWMEADDRWQFLAFCFDWAGYCAYVEEGRGEHYVSCLPCSQDGTCNGLQHFAAMWLDPVGGAQVNVSPGEKPQDIYQAIADVVTARLEKENATEPLALLWLKSGLVDRKLTKRPTMTFGYGSQRFGFTNQLTDYIQTHDEWFTKHKLYFSEPTTDADGQETRKSTLRPACSYMAGLIWDALGELAVSAFQGMAWMQGCAKVISRSSGKCVEWSVPSTGFLVRQGYMTQLRLRNVVTVLAGKVFKPSLFEDTAEAEWKKQASAVAPNIVHSLDAAALMLTVNASADSGVAHFAMVHDSYGTLAADAPVLAGATRQAFHSLYSHEDVVNSLWNQFAAQVKQPEDPEAPRVDLPVPPSKGAGPNRQLMDLSGVLLSDYFFS